MAQVRWTIPALNDLEKILERIELDNETAAKRRVQKEKMLNFLDTREVSMSLLL